MRTYAPGERKGNRTYICRGYIAGQQYEINTHTTNERAAKAEWRRFRDTVLAQGPEPEPREARTFSEVADLYIEARDPSKNDRRYIDALKSCDLGEMGIADITPADVQSAAHKLYRHARNETKNRQAIVPAAYVLHFAAKNGMRDYIVVDKLPERQPESRRPKPGAIDILIKNTDGRQRALLVFLKWQGWRITEALRLEWAHVDLESKRLHAFVSKAGEWKRLYMADAVFEEMANLEDSREGRVFPWGDRHNVYRWLRPLCEKLNVAFTPHMARHDFGSTLDELGVSSHGMTELGTWTSTKSTDRYKSAREDHARDVLNRMHAERKRPGKRPGVGSGKARRTAK